MNGTLFWTDRFGFVQSTDEQQGLGTPCLFQVELVYGNEKMKELLSDLFWLSKLHVGSTKEPKLPIPIYFADKLAKLAGKENKRNFEETEIIENKKHLFTFKYNKNVLEEFKKEIRRHYSFCDIEWNQEKKGWIISERVKQIAMDVLETNKVSFEVKVFSTDNYHRLQKKIKYIL